MSCRTQASPDLSYIAQERGLFPISAGLKNEGLLLITYPHRCTTPFLSEYAEWALKKIPEKYHFPPGPPVINNDRSLKQILGLSQLNLIDHVLFLKPGISLDWLRELWVPAELSGMHTISETSVTHMQNDSLLYTGCTQFKTWYLKLSLGLRSWFEAGC